jgi:hypothetical protein
MFQLTEFPLRETLDKIKEIKDRIFSLRNSLENESKNLYKIYKEINNIKIDESLSLILNKKPYLYIGGERVSFSISNVETKYINGFLQQKLIILTEIPEKYQLILKDYQDLRLSPIYLLVNILFDYSFNINEYEFNKSLNRYLYSLDAIIAGIKTPSIIFFNKRKNIIKLKNDLKNYKVAISTFSKTRILYVLNNEKRIDKFINTTTGCDNEL